MTRRAPHKGFRSEDTQRIANALQPWHDIRTDRSSVGQQLLNSVGMYVQDVREQMGDARRNLYPATADTLVRWSAYRVPLPQDIELKDPPAVNLLRNAHLAYPGIAHRQVPLEWTLAGGTYDTEDAKHGGGSVALSVAQGATGEFSQVVKVPVESGRTYVASVYIKGTGTLESAQAGFTLTATAGGWGTTVGTSSVTMPRKTGGEWLRKSVILVPTGRGNQIEFQVSLVNPDAETANVSLSAPQVTKDQITDFQPAASDLSRMSFRLQMVGPTGETQQRIELLPAYDQGEFFEDALPTRLSVTTGMTGTLLEETNGPRWFDDDRSQWETNWTIDGSEIVLEATQVPGDEITRFSLADRYIGNEAGTGEYGVLSDEEADYARTIEAVTSWRDRLYLMCLETKAGVTTRTLKIASARGLDGELEILHDISVGMDTGTVTRFGFIEGHMEKMAIGLSDLSFRTLTLSFDRFLYDPRTRQVLLRHPYVGMTPTFIEF